MCTAAPSWLASPTTAASTAGEGLRTFSKRGERGDRDLWGQHLKNLLDRLGKSAATLVDWEFHTINGGEIARISVDPSDHPVYETKAGQQVFWWRTPVSTDAVADDAERQRIIARRWGP